MAIPGRTRKTTRAFWFLLGICAALALAGQTARADGMVFFSRDAASMSPLSQHEQRAAIVCRDGVERLVIAVNIELDEDAEALWIFPVPGTPDAVTIDLVDSFPAFEGTDPFEEGKEAIAAFGILARATQLWPLIVEGLLAPAGGSLHAAAAVHTSVEKWGMRAEVVTAGSAEALAQYLRDKGSALDAAELVPFEPYMSDDYVLIVAWIASQEQFQAEFPDYGRPARTPEGRWPCIYVEFPSERPFYPMRPTSAYGEEYIPLTLTVAGSVAPSRQEGAQFYPDTSHWWASGRPEAGPARFLEALPQGRFAYTRCYAIAPAEMFTADLWFEPVPEPDDTTYGRIVVALLFRRPAVLTYIVLIAALSYVAGGLVGLLMFRKWRSYARIGLWNLLTLIAVHFAVRRARDWHDLSLPRKPGGEFRPGGFTFLFSVTYVALTIIFCQLLKLPLR